jgi:hypothetical protein
VLQPAASNRLGTGPHCCLFAGAASVSGSIPARTVYAVSVLIWTGFARETSYPHGKQVLVLVETTGCLVNRFVRRTLAFQPYNAFLYCLPNKEMYCLCRRIQPSCMEAGPRHRRSGDCRWAVSLLLTYAASRVPCTCRTIAWLRWLYR